MSDRFGLVWYRADFDLPATKVERWEEDSDTGFRGWVDPHDGAVISGVTHWRQLPDPPGGAT